MSTYRDQGPARASRRTTTDTELRARRLARAERALERTATEPDWVALEAELHTLSSGRAFKAVTR